MKAFRFTYPKLVTIKESENQRAIEYSVNQTKYRVNYGRILGHPELRPNGKPLSESLADWQRMISIIAGLLAQEINPVQEDRLKRLNKKNSSCPRDGFSLGEMFDYMFSVKQQASLDSKSIADVRRRGRVFQQYLDNNRALKNIHFSSFRRPQALMFLKAYENGKPATYDNMKKTISSIFKVGLDEGYLENNPFTGIADLNDERKLKVIFTKEQETKLRALMREIRYYELELAAMLSSQYYLSTKELLGIRREHFHPDMSKIYLPKNYVPGFDTPVKDIVPDELRLLLKEIGVADLKSKMYVLGQTEKRRGSGFINGLWQKFKEKDRAMGANQTLAHKQILIDGQSFTTFKDTAVYKQLKSEDFMRVHAKLRNKKLSTTKGYLEALGFTIET